MQPPRFLIGKLPTGEERWAAIDPNTHHLEAGVAERRFGAYLKPFADEGEAHRALIEAGAVDVHPEHRPRRNRRD